MRDFVGFWVFVAVFRRLLLLRWFHIVRDRCFAATAACRVLFPVVFCLLLLPLTLNFPHVVSLPHVLDFSN